jgi:peroxiredoxin
MYNPLVTLMVLGWLIIVGCGWLGWQLLRQNGRMLLRVEALEQRLDELEFGGSADVGDDARSLSKVGDQSLLTSAPTDNGDERADRFKNHSLARSKIKRDGLKAGTPAPDFRLPCVDGRGELSLSEFHGQRVLLVFSSTHCGPCNTLAPVLEKFHRQNRDLPNGSPSPGGRCRGKGEPSLPLQVVMISKGEPKENRAKVKEHGLTFPILLQQQWEISRRYATFATPTAYLIDERGVIARDVAVGTDAIQALFTHAANLPEQLVFNDNGERG